jgi:hypothetical protein
VRILFGLVRPDAGSVELFDRGVMGDAQGNDVVNPLYTIYGCFSTL